MGKVLVIVESPAKAKKIGAYLNSQGGEDKYIVKSSIGHIRDIPVPSKMTKEEKEKYPKFGINIEKDYSALYKVSYGKSKVITDLKKEYKEADLIMLATDEDREGEAIAWHLIDELSPKRGEKKPFKRMVFHEITKEAIIDALSKTRELDVRLIDAQESRRILDRFFGFEFSPILWRRYGPSLSAGRVQTPTTKILVERELERFNFKKANYTSVIFSFKKEDIVFKSNLTNVNGKRLAAGKDFNEEGELKNKDGGIFVLEENEAKRISEKFSGENFKVDEIKTRETLRNTKPPFTTSTLQQSAGNILKFSVARTMGLAQKLYEGGFITYMRTDSVSLSAEALNAAYNYALKNFGRENVLDAPKNFASKSKNAQEAHEAIRPAGKSFRSPEEIRNQVDFDEFRLYQLIFNRTIASQMKPAKIKSTTAVLSSEKDGDEIKIKATGSIISFKGYLNLFNDIVEANNDPESDNLDTQKFGDGVGSEENQKNTENVEIQKNTENLENQRRAENNGNTGEPTSENETGSSSKKNETQILPDLNEGEELKSIDSAYKISETKPPARYTESSLVKKMEELGIGRPSTYASTIQTIINRKYAFKKGQALVPTFLAIAIIDFFEKKLNLYAKYEFTSDLEERLDRVAAGEIKKSEILSYYYFGDNETFKGIDADAKELLKANSKKVDAKKVDAKKVDTKKADKKKNDVEMVGDKEAGAGDVDAVKADENVVDEKELDAGDVDAKNDSEFEDDIFKLNNGYQIHMYRAGAYLENDPPQFDNIGNIKRGQVPIDLTAEELTEDVIKGIIDTASTFKVLGKSARGYDVIVKTGPYGAYFTEVLPPDTKTKGKGAIKAKMGSLLPNMEKDSVTIEDALKVLSLPRELGIFPDDEMVIKVNNGRFGPYLMKNETKVNKETGALEKTGKVDFRSIKKTETESKEERMFTITLDEAIEVYRTPKVYRRGRRRK